METTHRMSPQEASARADELIAQYRATTPKRASRTGLATPRVSRPGVTWRGGLSPRRAIALAFVAGAVAAGGWHAHPLAWSLVVGVPLVAFGSRIVTRVDETSGDDDAPPADRRDRR